MLGLAFLILYGLASAFTAAVVVLAEYEPSILRKDPATGWRHPVLSNLLFLTRHLVYQCLEPLRGICMPRIYPGNVVLGSVHRDLRTFCNMRDAGAPAVFLDCSWEWTRNDDPDLLPSAGVTYVGDLATPSELASPHAVATMVARRPVLLDPNTHVFVGSTLDNAKAAVVSAVLSAMRTGPQWYRHLHLLPEYAHASVFAFKVECALLIMHASAQ